MSVLIFRLRNVPEDEADDVRHLLDEHKIDWFETTAGNWSIAMPGIWLKDDDHASEARVLIDQYQSELSSSQRDLFIANQRAGAVPTVWDRLRTHPLRSAGIFVFCLFILFVSINPFLQLIGFSQ